MPKKQNQYLVLSQHFYPTLIGSAAYITDFARWLGERHLSTTVVTDRPFYPDYEIAPGYEAGKRDHEEVFGADVIRLPTYVPKGGGAGRRLINESVFLSGVLLRLLTGKIKRSDSVVSLCPSILTVLGGIRGNDQGGPPCGDRTRHSVRTRGGAWHAWLGKTP
ncbi:MAG: hypothetical protein HC834_01300 [Rhodospirillales bacterium]|nr:hypothetical protein [Rhodospirillales bacterium]